MTDLEWGAFSDNPPWVLDRNQISWLTIAPVLRQAARKEVPVLTKPSRIPPVLRLLVVMRTLVAALLPWLWHKKLNHFACAEDSRTDISKRMRKAVEKLGSTYIKLGQIISSGEGLFPTELVDEFKLCRDQVPAESFEDVRKVVEQDLGGKIADTFAFFETTPLAAASIAQVHLARLLTGETVVVKVQRPNVKQLVRKDLKVMSWLAPHLVGRLKIAALANPPALVELFAETIVEELDFRMEADNMIDIAQILKDLNQTGYIVPRPHPKLVTQRVLVMERLEGFKFDDVVGMKNAGIDTEAVIRTGMIAFMEGAMIHGALRDLGALPMDTDLDAVIIDLGLDRPPIDPTKLSADELVKEVQRIMKALLGYGAKMPKELMLYVKNMVFLDGAISRLAPDLDLLGEIAAISMLFAQRHGEQLGRELGIDHNTIEINLDSVKAGLGVELETNSLTYRELQQRRELIQKRMRERVKR